jgi:hypothetical protein
VRQESFGQGFLVGGDGVGQKQLQDFVIMQGSGAALEKALPQAEAGAVEVGLFPACLVFDSYGCNVQAL